MPRRSVARTRGVGPKSMHSACYVGNTCGIGVKGSKSVGSIVVPRGVRGKGLITSRGIVDPCSV